MYAISAKAQPRLRRRILDCQINVPTRLPQLESLHCRSKELLNLLTDTVGRRSWPIRSAGATCGHASKELALNIEDLDMDGMDEKKLAERVGTTLG